jgi:Ca-activated chloride channel family protein
MKTNLDNIRISKKDIQLKKSSVFKLSLLVVAIVLIFNIFNIKAYATILSDEQYAAIKSGEVFYKTKDGIAKKAIGLNTKVSMQITGIVNRVRVEQTFKNPDDYWTEGIYLFPLPDDAAVDHMDMKIGDTIITGEIKKKEEAKKVYETAKAEGKKTTLIEQQRPNLFTANVANIPPKGEITVIIEYQQKVQLDSNNFSVTFPMVAAQRYLPLDENNNLQNKSDINLIQTVEDKNNPIDRPVDFSINLKAGFEIDKIESAYHEIDIDKKDDNYFIKLLKTTQANKEFSLSWQAKKTQEVQMKLYTQKAANREFGLLMVTPENDIYKYKEDYKPKRELIFVIDSSGSMSGTSIIQAKKALGLAINRLGDNDRFNIIDYDNNFQYLFPTAKNVTKSTLQEAGRFISNIKADGGTQALEPIKFALNSKNENSKEYLRQIIFITDGLISNEEAIFKEVKNDNGDSKLFTISIGSAPNTFFMKKVATFGKGTFTHIGKESEVSEKMDILFKKIENPSLTNIKIDGVDLKISDLYFGESVFYSFEAKSIPETIKISAQTANGKYEKTIKSDIQEKNSGLDILWARNSIEELTNLYYTTYDTNKKEQLKELITNIGLTHHIVTNFTSLVAVDKTPVREKEKILKTKNVETKIPDGWKLYDAQVPQTATNSMLYLTIGLIFILISLIYLKIIGLKNEKII